MEGWREEGCGWVGGGGGAAAVGGVITKGRGILSIHIFLKLEEESAYEIKLVWLSWDPGLIPES